MNEKQSAARRLSAAEQSLSDLWEKHLGEEFTTQDTEATLATMVPDAYVNHIPVLTGGVGLEQLRVFYSRHFIPKMPPDTEIVPVSRTIGSERLVDEMIFKFTHTIEMDWMLAMESWRMSISIGIRPQCWCRSGFSIRLSCPSLAWKPRERSLTRDCQPIT
jgi:hypothetical protein